MLAHLLAPVSLDAFVAQNWERLPLHVARGKAGYFDDVYGVGDVEDALVSGSRELEQFALVRAGGPDAVPDTYVITRPAIRGKWLDKAPQRYLDQRKITTLFARGYTLVIKDGGLLTPRLQRACNRLQNDLGAYVGANVYFTPPAAQGFDIHHDSHDTLTLQIEGRKTWRIYEPAVPLPLESQPLNANTERPPLTLHREVTLTEGDTLYIPRGYPHEAVATDTRALHVTFALAPARTIDLLHAALDHAAKNDLDLRRSLPFGWQVDRTFPAAFADAVAPRLASFFSREAFETATQVAINDLFAASRSDAGEAFDQVAELAALGPDSILQLNENLPILLRERAQTVDVIVPGKSLGLPKVCLPALARLQAGPARFSELTVALSDEDRLFFVKTMILEGVLVVGAKNGTGTSGT